MRLSALPALLFVLSMCHTDTEIYRSTFRREYKNGKSIEVIREDQIKTRTGLITGTNSGTTDEFTYQFTIKPDDYKWQGYINQAPLALIFCEDQAYMRATERVYRYDSLYSDGHFKDTTLYFKNVDKRYFFKLFGDQYFEAMDSVAYLESKTKCSEVTIPIK